MSYKFFGSIVSCVLISLPVLSAVVGDFEVPPDSQSVHSVGTATRAHLPSRFTLLNWNVEKAKQGETWVSDFLDLQNKYDLFVVQEATSDDVFMNALKQKKDTLWNNFISWINIIDRSSTGLVIGSQAQPTSISFARTIDFEPILKTPKLTSYQTYIVEGLKNSELLLINIHAINFVTLEKFNRQIQQVMEQIDRHSGPVIFVGDMNTWSKKRFNLLLAETQKRNLVWFDFERPDVKGIHSDLDHVFVRGLKVVQVKSLTHVVSSDHFPISAEFEVF